MECDELCFFVWLAVAVKITVGPQSDPAFS